MPWTTLAAINQFTLWATAHIMLPNKNTHIAVIIVHFLPNISEMLPCMGIVTVWVRRKDVPIQKDWMLVMLKSAAMAARHAATMTALLTRYFLAS
jgi:hypothetical protein